MSEAEENLTYICNVCKHKGDDLQFLVDHINSSHTFANESEALRAVSAYTVQELPDERESSSLPDPVTVSYSELDRKLWTREVTLSLISLVDKYDNDFQTSVKKYIWMKISKLMMEKFEHKLTWQQCDTKWKSLKKTYKDVKDHNSSSGKNRRKWEYFDAMDGILFKKPEIHAPATCSSHTGLVVSGPKSQEGSTSGNKENESNTSETEISSVEKCVPFESSFSKKRKMALNASERRHKEKMQRQDRFLDCFEDFVKTYKNK
ncbi:unnamed protein product [Phaedon cochleariae]|uniref:Myb-like domain-containing protein n=1 Tax=Phaedon cochleariae TaxID=80249 RepID=A0A9N9SCP7_PHACE|nr:unnamed protein product [Phaedon cochleariae]